MATRVLLVDDDADVRATIIEYLASRGFTVDGAATVGEAQACLARERYAVVIVDMRLPDEDGISLARELANRNDVAVIMISGSADEVDRVAGIEAGAVDFVAKPLSLRELVARVRAHARRLQPAQPQPQPGAASAPAQYGTFTVDLAGRRIADSAGAAVHLTSTEFDLLAALLERVGEPVSREVLSRSVLGRAWSPQDRSLDTLVSALRKKLRLGAESAIRIVTMRNRGYALVRAAAEPPRVHAS